MVDAEWNILYDKLDRIAKSGAKVVLSKLPIGDVATQVIFFIFTCLVQLDYRDENFTKNIILCRLRLKKKLRMQNFWLR